MNTQPLTATSTWQLDPAHSSIAFTTKHMLISKVKGHFEKFEASYTTSGDELDDFKAKAKIQVDSINTGVGDRDAHLKSDDFFNAGQFPEITFVSKELKKTGGNTFKLIGDLTIRDVTKEIELDVEYNGVIDDPYGNKRAGFEITGRINRFDFNLKWNQLLETGGAVVAKDIQLHADVEFTRQAE